jgi:hypothetical protein
MEISKHILIVELVDGDNTCKWCNQKIYDRINDAWKCPFVPKRPITVNINASPKPPECPLIPVDKIEKAIMSRCYYGEGISEEQQAWNIDGQRIALTLLRDELGLEED